MSSVPHQLAAAALTAGAGVLVSPYLAGLTRTAPDRDDTCWVRLTRTTPARLGITAAIAAVLGALAGAAAGWTATLPAFVALAVVGTPLTVIDFEQHRLPNRLVFAVAALAAGLLLLAAAVTGDWRQLLRAAEGAAAVFAVLYLLAFAAPRSFGYGDVKLGGLLGGYLGWLGWGYVYYGIFGGFLLGAVVAILLLATRRASMKTALAFGPMLILGSLIVMAFRLVP